MSSKRPPIQRDRPTHGYKASGPGFHVWEESHSETVRSAGDLASAISNEQAETLRRRRRRSNRIRPA